MDFCNQWALSDAGSEARGMSCNCMLAKHELAADMSKIGYLGNTLESSYFSSIHHSFFDTLQYLMDLKHTQ